MFYDFDINVLLATNGVPPTGNSPVNVALSLSQFQPPSSMHPYLSSSLALPLSLPPLRHPSESQANSDELRHEGYNYVKCVILVTIIFIIFYQQRITLPYTTPKQLMLSKPLDVTR